MSITNDIEDLLTAFMAANGTSWQSMLTGGFFTEGNIPACAAESPPYGEWAWTTEKDIRTAQEFIDRHEFQVLFYGDDRRELNLIRDKCLDSMDTSWIDIKDIGFRIEIMKNKDAPGFKALPGDKKDRFSKYVAMAQFWFRAQKTCTITT